MLGRSRARLIGGRAAGRCIGGKDRTREQGEGNDWDELLEHRFGLQSERMRRDHYDWNIPPEAPYDRNVMLAGIIA
jgi:hypothetical protein